MYYEEGDIHSDITDLCWWCKYDNICWIQHNMKNAMSLLPACCNADLDVTQCKEFVKAKGESNGEGNKES